MGELVYNLFVYATNTEIKALGVATHRIEGNDDEKTAHLQGAVGTDFQVATQYVLSKPLPWRQFESLMRLGRALELFESVLTEIHAPRDPLAVITPVVDGAPRFDFVGGLGPPDMALVRSKELGLDSVMVDYLEKYLTPNGFDLPRLINDDYFEAIRLLFNSSHYVSSAKLLMSCLDTLGFIEFGDVPQSFQKWLRAFVELEPLGVTETELWEFRNGLLHMSNLASREVLKGNVDRLEFYVGPQSALANVKGVKRFSLHGLIRATAEAVSKWAESYNTDRNKFVDFVQRYDLTVSDARSTYIEVSPARSDDR